MVVTEEEWKEQSDSESKGEPQLLKYTDESDSSVQSKDLQRSLRERVEAKFTSPDGKGSKLSPQKTRELFDKLKFPEAESRTSQSQSKSSTEVDSTVETSSGNKKSVDPSDAGPPSHSGPSTSRGPECRLRNTKSLLRSTRALNRRGVRQQLWRSKTDKAAKQGIARSLSEQSEDMGSESEPQRTLRGKIKKRVDKYMKDGTYSAKTKPDLNKSLKAQRKSPRVQKSLLKKNNKKDKDSMEENSEPSKRSLKPGTDGKGNGKKRNRTHSRPSKRLRLKASMENSNAANNVSSDNVATASTSRSKPPAAGTQRRRKLRKSPSPSSQMMKRYLHAESSSDVELEGLEAAAVPSQLSIPLVSPGSPLPDIPHLPDIPSTSTHEDNMAELQQPSTSSGSQEASPTEPKPRSSSTKKLQLPPLAEMETAVSSTTGPTAAESLAVCPSAVAFFQEAVRKGRLNIGDRTEQCTSGKFEGHTAAIHCLVMWEQWMITGSEDHTVRRFDLKTRECLSVYKTHTKGIQCLIVTSTGGHGAQIYSGSFDNSVACHDLVSGELLTKTLFAHRVHCFHECWGCLYVGLGNGNVCCMDLKTHKLLDTFKCSDSPIRCVATAREGPRKLLCVASTDCSITIRDARTSLLIRTLEGHAKTPMTIMVANHLLYSGAADKTVQVHNINTGELERCLNHRGVVTSLGLKDGHLVTAGYEGLIRVFDTESWKVEQVYYGAGAGAITAMEINQNMLYSGNREGLVEGVMMDLKARIACKFGSCSYVFGRQDHLEHHVLHNHVLPNAEVTKCLWGRSCPEYLYAKDNMQAASEHILGHVMEDYGQTT